MRQEGIALAVESATISRVSVNAFGPIMGRDVI